MTRGLRKRLMRQRTIVCPFNSKMMAVICCAKWPTTAASFPVNSGRCRAAGRRANVLKRGAACREIREELGEQLDSGAILRRGPFRDDIIRVKNLRWRAQEEIYDLSHSTVLPL